MGGIRVVNLLSAGFKSANRDGNEEKTRELYYPYHRPTRAVRPPGISLQILLQ